MTGTTDSLRTASSTNAGAMLAPVLATRADGLDTFPSQKRSHAHTQRWAEKTDRPITKSETPQQETFDSPVWTEQAVQFARDLSGNGLDERFADPARVRAAWLQIDQAVLTTTPLQAAWLADNSMR